MSSRLNLDSAKGTELPRLVDGNSAGENMAAGAGPRSGQLERLYRTQKARLLRFFRRRTSADEAQDLVQETFVRFVAADTPELAALAQPEAYISRIAGNLLRDRAKFAARRSLDLHVPAEDEELIGGDQQRLLEARDMLDRLDAAMLQLKPLTREIFMAHRLDGYSYRDIASRTGLSVKAVEKHMSRAILHVTRSMSDR